MADDAKDLRKNPTGWKITYPNNGAVLVSPDGKKRVRFISEKENSGTEIMRQRALAQAWAIDNPLEAAPVPKGELVSKPLGSSKPTSKQIFEQNKKQKQAKAEPALAAPVPSSKIVVEENASGETVVSVPSKDKAKVPPAEQKKYFMAEIDYEIC